MVIIIDKKKRCGIDLIKAVLVIPNEFLTDEGIYYRVKNRSWHPIMLEEACRKYGLSIYDCYGNLISFKCIIRILYPHSSMTLYLPSLDSLTEKQIWYLSKLRSLFERYKEIEIHSWLDHSLHLSAKLGFSARETIETFYRILESHSKKKDL